MSLSFESQNIYVIFYKFNNGLDSEAIRFQNDSMIRNLVTGTLREALLNLSGNEAEIFRGLVPYYDCCFYVTAMAHPREQSSWGQHGAHLGPVGPRWAPC